MSKDNNASETKAERREKKKKPRMAVHGRGLKKASPFAGLAAAGPHRKKRG